jgi:hypothetical protein
MLSQSPLIHPRRMGLVEINRRLSAKRAAILGCEAPYRAIELFREEADGVHC